VIDHEDPAQREGEDLRNNASISLRVEQCIGKELLKTLEKDIPLPLMIAGPGEALKGLLSIRRLLILLGPAVPFVACSAFFLSHKQRPTANTMGLGASVLPKAEETARSKSSKSKDRTTHAEEWKKAVDAFTSKLLDPSYLTLPVRASTIEAAALYRISADQENENKWDSARRGGLMPGTHKHLGGAYDPTDGCIYGVPANSRSVLCLYHDKDSDSYRMKTIPLPSRIADCQFKWLRGIFAHGYLWAIPSWADSVLCVDVDGYWGRRPRKNGDDVVKLLPLPEGHTMGTRWQWHGAGINDEKTAIYCVPSNAREVLKVDLIAKTTSLIPISYDAERYPDFDIDSTNKWYGGITGNDNCVYGYVCSIFEMIFLACHPSLHSSFLRPVISHDCFLPVYHTDRAPYFE